MKSQRSRKEAVTEDLPAKKFPLRAEDYKLYEEVGRGVSAAVHRALCIPLNEIVAIKVMDLERCGTDLDVIRREVQTMTLLNDPHLLKAHCSFVSGMTLWIVTPFMDSGSALHIMKYRHPNGFTQPIIAAMLKAVLHAIAYLHTEGLIHRDVKAGNVLVDSKGTVKLADFGVSASLFDSGDRRHARNTFVGTPCWMAPEVMQQLHGYDFKADIWSFGITALELAHGHAPFSNYPPMKVLLMTIQNAPPGLDYERDKAFSRSFKDLVAKCLVKDPRKRPSAKRLLNHHFFKHAASNEYMAQTILQGLLPLGDRYRILKEKEASLFAQNKVMLGEEENISQKEYIKGISGWDFDPNDLKNQAALLGDSDEDDSVHKTENHGSPSKLEDESDNSSEQEKLVEIPNHSDSENSVTENPNGSSKSFPNGFSQTLEDELVHLQNGSGNALSGANGTHDVSLLSKVESIEKLESGPKDIPNGLESSSSSDTTASILPTLKYLLKQNSLQKEQIMTCLKYVQEARESATNKEHSQMFETFCREKVLESRLLSMTKCNEQLLKDLETIRMESAKLEKKIKALNFKE